MNIGIDIDGVIANVTWEIYRRAEREFGPSFPKPHTWDTYPQSEGWNLPGAGEWLHEQFKDSEFWINAIPYFATLRWIESLDRDNTFLHVISARGKYQEYIDIYGITSKWLKEHAMIDYDTLTLVETRFDKVDHLEEFGCRIMIEDDPRAAKQISEANIDSYLVTRPYNQCYSDLGWAKRIDRIEELTKVLEEHAYIGVW